MTIVNPALPCPVKATEHSFSTTHLRFALFSNQVSLGQCNLIAAQPDNQLLERSILFKVYRWRPIFVIFSAELESCIYYVL